MDDIIRPPKTATRRQWRRFGTGLALGGLLVTVGLLASACGGGSTNSGAANGSGTNTTGAPGGKAGVSVASGSSATQAKLLQLARCIRSHGVPNMPDPSASNGTLGAMVSGAGIDLQSPTVQAALTACKQYDPGQNLTPAQSAAQNASALQFAQCMRSHGVPNYPDPSASSGATGTGTRRLPPGIDVGSPTVQAAAKACGGLKP